MQVFSGMKCMFCGCTDDNACPGGCSWAAPNVCSRCIDRLKENDLISGEEIRALKANACTITLQDAKEMRMKIIIPMDLKSGYGVSYSLVEGPAEVEVLSVGSRSGEPDPADCERIALAVLGEGYISADNLFMGNMVHFVKRKK